jgi:hypothetical protein
MNSELYNFVLNDISNNNDTTSYGADYLSLTLPGEQQQSFSHISDDIFVALILEESEKLYNELITKLTNSVVAAAAGVRASSSLLPSSQSANNNNQKLSHKNDTYV